MKKDDYTVGKDASCSYVIKDSQLEKLDYNLLPKKVFKISRKKDSVYLEDVAVTYVNDKKVGQGQKTVLNHNDRIAIVKPHLRGRKYCKQYSHQAHFY
jgi:predicted component of type VI protein secretion system